MLLEIAITLLLGTLLFTGGMRLGRILLRQGATANDLFGSKTSVSLAFLGFYFGSLLLVLNVPQMQALPLEWRFHGMRVTWTLLRVILMGVCGVAFTISWYTARIQVVAVVLIGLLGFGGFTSVETYFLEPVYASLQNHLLPNGVFKQTSSSSCAPAALATLLRRWHILTTESAVARLAGTSRLGTSMPQLIVAAQALGMDGLELNPTWEQMQEFNRPGILGVWLFNGDRKLPHAVALLALSADTATIADPARGRIFELDRATFARIWRDQYVPIFRPADVFLTNTEAADYLRRSGYLATQTPDSLSSTIRQFQRAKGLRASGDLDSQTVLLLNGPFLAGVPTLGNSATPEVASGLTGDRLR